MLPTFRILPPSSAALPPSPTTDAGVAAVLAAGIAVAGVLAVIAAVPVGGHASAAVHGARGLPPLAQGPAPAALAGADGSYRVDGRTLRFRIVR